MKSLIKLGLMAVLAGALLPSQSFARITGTPASGEQDDRWNVGPDGKEVAVNVDGDIVPTTDDNQTLGTSALAWSALHVEDVAIQDDLTVADDVSVGGELTVTGESNLNSDVLIPNGILLVGTSILDGNHRIVGSALILGYGSTPDVSPGADDLYIEGTLEVDGASRFDGAMTLFSRTQAQLEALTPAVGDLYYCSDCSDGPLCIGTSTVLGDFVIVGTGMIKCD